MAKKEQPKDVPTITFEEQLERLRNIVEKMEQGGLTLDESLKLFEEGIGLSGKLFEQLNRAESRVEELLSTLERVPFDREEQ